MNVKIVLIQFIFKKLISLFINVDLYFTFMGANEIVRFNDLF